MQDLLTRLSSLNRPRLLVRAARIGASDYCRTRHVQRLLGFGQLPKPARAIILLIEQEQNLNRRRQNNDPGYPLVRHIEVLIALMGESKLLANNRTGQGAAQAVTTSGDRSVISKPNTSSYENASDIDAFFSAT